MPRKVYTGQGGPNNRPLRYPAKVTTKISQDAFDTLEEMAQVRKRKVATLVRRAVMKDIYIYKREKERHEEVEAELGEAEQ
jgi:hypothetical protein